MKALRVAVPVLALFLLLQPLAAAPLTPLRYTISFPQPASKTFNVDVVVPTEGKPTVELMMAIWAPGFYGLQNYADRVTAFSAKAADGSTLLATKSSPSRWQVATEGKASFTFSYTLSAPRPSNLSNGVTETGAVILGPSSYVTLVEKAHRPAEVLLQLPAGWTGSMTSLDAAKDGAPNHYVAPDYDTLADSPILAGSELTTTSFTAAGIPHHWTYLGKAEWAGDDVVKMLKPLIEAHAKFWRGLPIKKYAFLNIVTGGGGGSGVEHLNSVAITTGGRPPVTQEAKFRNAAFISHEYFHAMNVKRLRPVELGPFDYEHSPVTTGLWVAEGLTSYFGDLLAARAGIGSVEDYLALCSRHITDLQTKQPGRLVQTIEQASAQMFERIPADKKVDYYVKGPVVGMALEARIRRMTNGKKSMDDVMRLEYKRWSGARGYSAADFAQTAADAVGFDIKPLMHTLVATTDEVDYTEFLDWFGLRFITGDPARAWTLEIRPDQTPAQKANLAALLKNN